MKMHVISMVVGVAVLAGASNAQAVPLFSNQRSGQPCCNFFQIDNETAATSNVNSQANSGMAGLAYDVTDDILYGVRNSGNSELFTINQAIGTEIKIGDTGIFDIVGLAYDNATRTLWASTNGTGGGAGAGGTDGLFYRLDPTDASTLFSVTGFQERLDGLAYGNGNLYVQQESTTGTIFVVDQTLGTGTAIPNQNLPNTASWQGLAFESETGLLYAADCCAGGNGQLWSVDPNTGATALVGASDTFRLQSLAPSTGLVGSNSDFEWKENRSGDWNVSGNWTPGGGPPGNPTADNSGNHTATFGNVIQSNRTVFADSDVSVRAIVFDNANTYIVAGPASVSLIQSTQAGFPANSIINVANGTHQFQLNVELQNNADVDVTSGATLEFNNRLFLNGNTLTKLGGGTIAVNNDVLTGGGTIDVQAGTLSGGGTVGGNVDNSGGTIAPGNSPGVLTVNGNLNNAAGGTIAMEIEGTDGPGEAQGHDQIQVTGNSTLDGTLNINPGSGYSDPTVRAARDNFTLISSAGGSTGAFATVNYNGTALSADFTGSNGSFRDHIDIGLFRHVNYDGSDVSVTNLFALEGDADGDIDIDITDFNILASNFDDTGANSATNDWTTADFDADGDVDITDFNFLAANFADTGYGGTISGQVPEPTSVVLLGLGGLLLSWLFASRRRK